MASLVENADDKTGGFSFFWTIENLLCLSEYSCYSPGFMVKNVSCYKLLLGIDPSQESFYLSLCRGDVPVSRNCVFSVRNADGSFEKLPGESNRVNLPLGNLPEEYLVKNGLTIRCRIWDDDSDLSTRVSCHARTVFWTEKIVRSWTLEDFEACDSGRGVTLKSASDPDISFTIELKCDTDNYGNEKYYFEVRKNFDKEEGFWAYCKFSVLNTRKEQTFGRKYWRFFYQSCRDVPFMKKSQLLGDRKKYLSNGSLNLRVGIEFPTGGVSSEIVKTEHDEIAKESDQPSESLVLLVEQVTQHVCKDVDILYNISA